MSILLSKFSFYLLVCLTAYALTFQFLNLQLTRRTEWVFNLLLLVLLCTMAYNVWPGIGSDLARYFLIMEDMQTMPWTDIFLFGHYKNTFLTNILMGFVAHSGNYKLLPLLSTFFVMVNLFYLLKMERVRVGLNHSTKLAFLMVVFSIVTLMSVTTCVRHAWMASIFAVAVYRDFVLQKRDWMTVLLYVAACMIHSSALMLILVRFCALLKGKFKWFILLWILIAPFLQKLTQWEGLIGEGTLKFFEYQTMGAEGLDIRLRLARLGFLITMLFIWFYVRKTKRTASYMSFYFSLLLFTFGSISIPHIFYRLIDMLAFTSLPVLNEFFQTQNSRQVLLFKFLLAFIAASLFCYHGVFIKTFVSFV